MKIVKIMLSVITFLFALLGLIKVLPFDITNPIMFLALATLLLIKAIEFKKSKHKSGFVLLLIESIFLYVITFYNVFIG